MNGGGKMDAFNASIRAVCVIVLLGGFVFAFVWGVFTSKLIIGSDAYIGVLTLALTWWFKSRDDEHAQKATAEATTATAATTAATIAAVTGTGAGGPSTAAATQMAAAQVQQAAADTQLDAAKRDEAAP